MYNTPLIVLENFIKQAKIQHNSIYEYLIILKNDINKNLSTNINSIKGENQTYLLQFFINQHLENNCFLFENVNKHIYDTLYKPLWSLQDINLYLKNLGVLENIDGWSFEEFKEYIKAHLKGDIYKVSFNMLLDFWEFQKGIIN